MKKVASAIIVASASVLALASSPAQAINLQGDSSNKERLKIVSGTFPPGQPAGYAGLRFRNPDNYWSFDVGILGGPIKHIRETSRANSGSEFYATMPIIPVRIAQAWHNTQSNVANVYSLRQIINPPLSFAPRLGGLVVGQVKASNSTSYSNGSGVYFGEWAPQVSSPDRGNSTDLNMGSAERVVWYAGDNAVSRMPTLVNAQYRVVGIRQTGVGNNLPHAPNLYAGTLTANYRSGNGALTGALARGGERVDFAGTGISADGKFSNGTTLNGRFYNNAAALAGIYTGGQTRADHVAFGGNRSN